VPIIGSCLQAPFHSQIDEFGIFDQSNSVRVPITNCTINAIGIEKNPQLDELIFDEDKRRQALTHDIVFIKTHQPFTRDCNFRCGRAVPMFRLRVARPPIINQYHQIERSSFSELHPTDIFSARLPRHILILAPP
jgi:hypothetical protein